tara:strand:+ start:3254 stop:3559 length:306 start_codon:yes stop_codon:yes gene_type:complete
VALEPIGESFAVDKLKTKLQKKYPNHNFDLPAPLDRKHKAPYLCKDNKIFYEDMEGNVFCGCRYKKQDDTNPYKWDWAVCHALVTSANEKQIHTDNQKEMF